MIRVLAIIAITAFVGYLLACAGLFLFQRALIYYPQPKNIVSPTLSLPTDDGAVLVSVQERPRSKALLYFGGNAEDVSLGLPGFSEAFPDYSLYFLHYRGYGGSAGRPSEAALVHDALALYDIVRQKHKEIAIVGRSLGSGIAVQVASQKAVSRLALVTPYDSVAGIAAAKFPYIPVKYLLQDSYDSGSYAPKVKAPVLILMAEHDEMIPGHSTKLLYARFPKAAASLKVIPDAGHNDISLHSQYMGLLQAFLSKG